MRITLTPARMDGSAVLLTGAPLALTGEHPDGWVQGLGGATEWEGGPVPLVDSAEPRFLDFGNETNVLAFRVYRVHDTAALAGLYYLEHTAALPHLARVQCDLIDTDGSLVTRRFLPIATVRAVREDWRGKGTTIAYTLTGGQLTAA